MADEMIPVLRPLLAPDDALTASRNQLILRTDPVTLEQVRGVIRQLDRAPRNLLVSVRRVGRNEAFSRGYAVSGRIEAGDAQLAIGDPGENDLEVRARSRSRHSDSGGIASVRVLEGQSALISAGSNPPVVRAAAPGGVYPRGAGAGFTVLPRVSGDSVTLRIESSSNAAARGTRGVRESGRIDTVITGRPGEWITLGGFDGTSGSTASGIASGSRKGSTRDEYVQVKVEIDP